MTLNKTMSRQGFFRVVVLLFFGFSHVSFVKAESVKVQPSISSSLYAISQDGNLSGTTARSGEVVQTIPSLNMSYDGPLLQLSSILEYEHIERSPSLVTQNNEQTSSYSRVNAKGKLHLIREIMSLESSVRKYQQVQSSEQGVFSDKLIDPSSFIDVFSYDTSLVIKNPTPSQVFIESTFNVASTETDGDNGLQTETSNIDSNSEQFTLRFSDGYRDQLIRWNLGYNVQSISRNNYGTYETEIATYKVISPTYKNVGLIVSGDTSKYQVEGNETIGDSLDYSQVGLGLNYDFSSGTSLSIFQYQSDSSLGEEEYIGLDFKWRISSLSSLQFQRSKDATGNKSTFTFTQNNRYLRTRINYSKGITVNTSQSYSTGDIGSYICPAGSTSISECYQPDSLSYEPNINETRVEFAERELDLTEQITNQEIAQFSLGYDNQRKIRANVSYSYSESVGLENSSYSQTQQTISSSLSYLYSDKTITTIQGSLVESQRYSESSNDIDATITFKLDKTLTKKTNLSLSYVIRARESEYLNSDYNEQRLGVQFRYIGR